MPGPSRCAPSRPPALSQGVRALHRRPRPLARRGHCLPLLVWRHAAGRGIHIPHLHQALRAQEGEWPGLGGCIPLLAGRACTWGDCGAGEPDGVAARQCMVCPGLRPCAVLLLPLPLASPSPRLPLCTNTHPAPLAPPCFLQDAIRAVSGMVAALAGGGELVAAMEQLAPWHGTCVHPGTAECSLLTDISAAAGHLRHAARPQSRLAPL